MFEKRYIIYKYKYINIIMNTLNVLYFCFFVLYHMHSIKNTKY